MAAFNEEVTEPESSHMKPFLLTQFTRREGICIRALLGCLQVIISIIIIICGMLYMLISHVVVLGNHSLR